MGRLKSGSGRVLLACLIVQATVAGLAGTASASLPGASSMLVRAPYLTDVTTRSVQVSWATTTQGRGVVEYARNGRCAASTATARQLGSPITVNGVREFQNSVQISGLSPRTSYCYRVTTGGRNRINLLGSNVSPSFTTLPRVRGTRPFTFDVMGDWGDTTNGAVNNGTLNTNQARIDALIAGSHAQFAVSTGDTAYPGGTQTDYGDLNQTGINISAVFGPRYWAVPGQRIPYFAVTGNHGRNSNFLSVWPEQATAASSAGVYRMVSYPSIDGAKAAQYPTSYYAFSTGNTRFYMLDASWSDSGTGRATGGTCGAHCAMYQVDHDAHWTVKSAEYQWLTRDLAAHRGGLKFAFFHFPLYSDDSTEPNDPYLDNIASDPGSLEKLLHDNGVDLVFNGHAHDYQRNIARPGGVTSYVTGGAGAQASPVGGHGCASTDAYAVGWSYSAGRGSACGAAPTPTSDAQVYNFLRVTVAGLKVTVQPINALGQAFDVHAYDFAKVAARPAGG
jgi:hypothetical protein